jgi:hypothetical protein
MRVIGIDLEIHYMVQWIMGMGGRGGGNVNKGKVKVSAFE